MPHRRLSPPPAEAEGLPAYEGLLDACHRAFRPELKRLVAAVPLPADARVLDVPCGDGFYSGLLAARMGKEGVLTLADRSPAYLARARAAVAEMAPDAAPVAVEADAYALPFAEGSFDVVWCAQSLISLDDPTAAVREMRRVVRPGGVVAILETDEFHHVLLPWPVELEAALQAAVLQGSRRRYGRAGKLHAGRRLRQVLADAGLRPACKRTEAADRLAPFDDAVRMFLRLHLRSLRDLTAPYLDATQRDRFDRLAGEGTESLLWRDDAELTCLNTLVIGRRGRTD